jgi:hypothetical protein
VPNIQWKTPDDGQRNCPKHLEFLDKNKFGKISASVGFIIKKFVTMHGHMNVRYIYLDFGQWQAIFSSPENRVLGQINLLFLAYEGIEKTVPEDTTSPICLGFNS